MSRKHANPDEATEPVEAQPDPSKTYAEVVAEIAAGAKTLVDAGLGGSDAASLAYDIYVMHLANPCPPCPPTPAAE